MKAKVQLDKDALIRFFTENGEKIIFGVAVLVFFMFVWGAIKVPRYDKTPEDLQKVVTNAKDHIRNADAEIKDIEIPNYLKIIRDINKPIPAAPYQLVTNWTTSVFPPLRKRGQPPLERVEDLVATPGHGRLSDPSHGGGGLVENDRPKGKRWIVLTGLFNMEKLRKSYKVTFEDVKPPPKTYEPDFFSEYYSFYVERAEITNETQKPEWKMIWDVVLVPPDKIRGGSNRSQEPPTDPECLLQPIVYPLPPRADREWGEEVLHAPEIPMIVESENPSAGSMRHEEPGIVPGEINPLLVQPRPEDNRVATDTASEKTSPYVLFRFFDFNVQPGKKYRYRVLVYLKNPNFDVPLNRLDPELVKIINDPNKSWKEYIATDWSEPSKVAYMPPDDNLLLTEVSSSRAIDAEPSATITAIHWDYMKGIEIFDEIKEGISRGKVVNLLNRDMPINEAGSALGPDQEKEKVNYVTNMLVLDLKGGESLSKRNGFRKPSSLLLFSPGGSLIVRSSIEDKKEREKLEDQPSGPRRGFRRPRGGPFMDDEA